MPRTTVAHQARATATVRDTLKMRTLLAVNPDSGGTTDSDALVAAAREHSPAIEVIELGDLAHLHAYDVDRIVVAGGDGSVGGAFAAAHRCGAALGVIPTGTANDFAGALALPTALDEALALALSEPPPLTPIWGGTVNGHPFVNTASVGLAVDATTRAATLKGALGPLAYPLGAVLAALRPPVVRARLRAEGAELTRGNAHQLLFGATGRFGGAAGLGSADASTPHLVATWIPARSRIALIRRAIGLVRRTLEHQSAVRVWHSEAFELQAQGHGGRQTWNLDGEVLEMAAASAILALGPVSVISPTGVCRDAAVTPTLGD